MFFMIAIMKDEQLNIVTIDGIDYFKIEEENSILLKSIQKDKDGYYMSMRFSKNQNEDDENKFQKIIEGFFMREIIKLF